MSTPPIIDPHSVFTLETARKALNLAESSLKREVRLGRLRVSRRGGRYFILGAWLLQWLESGEIRRKKSAGVNGAAKAERN